MGKVQRLAIFVDICVPGNTYVLQGCAMIWSRVNEFLYMYKSLVRGGLTMPLKPGTFGVRDRLVSSQSL